MRNIIWVILVILVLGLMGQSDLEAMKASQKIDQQIEAIHNSNVIVEQAREEDLLPSPDVL